MGCTGHKPSPVTQPGHSAVTIHKSPFFDRAECHKHSPKIKSATASGSTWTGEEQSYAITKLMYARTITSAISGLHRRSSAFHHTVFSQLGVLLC